MTPTNPERAIDTAIMLRKAGRGGEAAELLERTLAAHPRNARLWQTLGTVHRARQDSAAAIDAFAEAARQAPNDMKAAYGVAQASLEAGRPAAALFEAVKRLAPSEASVWLGQTAALFADGRATDAITTLDAVVRANPLWLDGQAALARLKWMLGDSQGFASGYFDAIRSDPGNVTLWSALTDLLIHVERYADARAVVTEARRATGMPLLLALADAICASEIGDVATADAGFAALGKLTDVAVVERHARHLLRTRRADEAARRIEPLLEGSGGQTLWPYASLAWRLTGDHRAEWLEGDPELVAAIDLEMLAPLLPALSERLRTLHQAKRDPLGQSVRGGTQTDGPLFALEASEIRAVRAAVVEAVERYSTALGAPDPTHPTRRHAGKRFIFSGSWSVRLSGAGHHTNHVHPNGWLSSALYVALPSEETIGPAPSGWLQLGEPPRELGLDLPPFQTIEPKPGKLVLFPSTMWHGTVPINRGERLTIAFDVAPVG